jgi:hypothetical protein
LRLEIANHLQKVRDGVMRVVDLISDLSPLQEEYSTTISQVLQFEQIFTMPGTLASGR